MALGQLAMSLVIFAVAVFLFINTFSFPTFEQYGAVDSDFWPKIVLILLMFCSAMLALETFLKRHTIDAKGQEKKEDYDPKGLVRMLGTGALLALYIFAGLKYLGFLLSTFLFTPLLMYWLGNRKPIVIALTTLISTSFFVIIFCKIMLIPLPRGMGIFRTFSLFFY